MIVLIEKYGDRKQVVLKWFLHELNCLKLWQADPDMVEFYRVKSSRDAEELTEIYQVAIDAIKATMDTAPDKGEMMR